MSRRIETNKWLNLLQRSIVVGGILAIVAVANAAGPADRAIQLQRGEHVYATGCASCHGASLAGGAGPALRPISHEVAVPGKAVSAASLASWIQRNMPVSDPGSLSQAESHDVLAFILARNDALPGSDTLSAANAGKTMVRGGKP